MLGVCRTRPRRSGLSAWPIAPSRSRCGWTTFVAREKSNDVRFVEKLFVFDQFFFSSCEIFSMSDRIRILGIDLLPNYGPGTSKRYRKPVTTGNTVISNCEKRIFRRSSYLTETKI